MKRVKRDRPVVLYVEDDDTNWQVAQLRLGDRFELRRAASAVEACRAVNELRGQLHAILMDIHLQGSELDGIALTKLFCGKPLAVELPAFTRGLEVVGCPIFYVTAYGNLHSEQVLLESGADGVLPKPVDFARLTLQLANLTVIRALRSRKP